MRSLQKIRNSGGFTIIELMLVLLVAGVLLAIGIPSFQTTIKNNQLVSTTNEIIGAINFARVEAIKRGANVHLGGGSGNVGWAVWIDTDGDNVWDSGEEIRVWDAPPDSIAISATGASYYVFNSLGLTSSTGSLTICDDRSGETGSKIQILGSGVVSRTSEPCS